MCLACVGACPVGALQGGQEAPQLRFIEAKCVQCGICATTCPERAITLSARLSLSPEAREPRVLNEAAVFNCVSCGKPLGTEKMIAGMLARLSSHSMFAAPGALDRLKMCADCRVVDLMKNERSVDIRRNAQTGIADPYEDWFPLSCVTPFSKLLSALRGEMTTHLSCHPHCSLGTYLFVDKDKQATPITRFVDVGAMVQAIDTLARKTATQRIKLWSKISAWNSLRKHYHEDRAPQGLSFERFLQTLQGLVDHKYGRGDMEKQEFSYKTLMVASMHFMDSYNYDIERVKRCVIHYAAPNGLIYPFCTYNSGPTFRDRIEKKYSVPFESQLVNLS